MDEEIIPDPGIEASTLSNTLEITSPPQDIKTHPTLEEVQKITKEIVREESLRVKDSLATNSVTVLGIFASFIAFLTIEVQILKTICDYLRILGFSLFILGAIFLFVGFIIYFTDSQNKKNIQINAMVVVASLLIIGGVVSIVKSDDEYVCKLNRLDEKFQELQANLVRGNEEWLTAKSKEFEALKKPLQECQK